MKADGRKLAQPPCADRPLVRRTLFLAGETLHLQARQVSTSEAARRLVDLIGGLRLPLELSDGDLPESYDTDSRGRHRKSFATLHLALNAAQRRIRRLRISEDDRKEQCESFALPDHLPSLTADTLLSLRRDVALATLNGTALLGTLRGKAGSVCDVLQALNDERPASSVETLYFAAFDDEVSDEEGLPRRAPERVVFEALQALEPAYDLLSSPAKAKRPVSLRERVDFLRAERARHRAASKASQQLEAEHHAKQATAIDAAARIAAARRNTSLKEVFNALTEDFCLLDDDDRSLVKLSLVGEPAATGLEIVLRSPSRQHRVEPLRLSITCDLAKQDSGEEVVTYAMKRNSGPRGTAQYPSPEALIEKVLSIVARHLART